MLVCVMCVLMLCSLAGCGNNTGTANDNLNDTTSGENYDGSGENDITNGVDDVADDLTQENGVQNKMQNNE